jgi:hypothetical protein
MAGFVKGTAGFIINHQEDTERQGDGVLHSSQSWCGGGGGKQEQGIGIMQEWRAEARAFQYPLYYLLIFEALIKEVWKFGAEKQHRASKIKDLIVSIKHLTSGEAPTAAP